VERLSRLGLPNGGENGVVKLERDGGKVLLPDGRKNSDVLAERVTVMVINATF